MIGRVKWFNNEKGYGFIEYKENEDIFVHYSAIENDGYKTLSEGQTVEFDLVRTEKGLQATNVKTVNEDSKFCLNILLYSVSVFLFLASYNVFQNTISF